MSGLRIYFEEGNEVVVSSCGPGVSAAKLASALGVIRDATERLDAADRATLRAKLAEVLAEPERKETAELSDDLPVPESERPWAVGDECEWERCPDEITVGVVRRLGPDSAHVRYRAPGTSTILVTIVPLHHLRRPGGAR